MHDGMQYDPAGCFAVLRQLRSIRRVVPSSVYQSLVVPRVLSWLDYGNVTSAAPPLPCSASGPVFYPDTLGLGGNLPALGEGVGGLWSMPPSGSGGLGEAPQKLEGFCCISSLFLSNSKVLWNCSFCIVYAIISYCS